ncbi:MAG: hypothetical protein IJJ01_09375 [Firmicutes bacterium]|nr:hypothetical protein [Bacillota bacterium]
MADWLSQTNREYIASLIPKDLPDWKAAWQEGFDEGKKIPKVVTPFCKEHGVTNEVDYRLQQAAKGKLTWRIIIGLSSLEEEIEGMKAIQQFNEETGLHLDIAHQIPMLLTGTPAKYRENLPKALGYLLDQPEDWDRIVNASNVQASFNDCHIGTPNAYNNTLNALKAGATYNGVFTQFGWDFDGCPDDVENFLSNIKAIGLVASKYDEKAVTDSYMDESMPAYFLDQSSYLAWGMLEHYLVSDLMKSRYSFSFGHYENKLIPKMALWLAGSDTFKLDDQPGVSYLQADSISHWENYVEANYGFAIPEALLAILVEKRYKTGLSWLSIPITEKVTIPTLEGILNMSAACQRAEEKAIEYEPLIDFTAIENLRDKIKDYGTKMFNNMMEGLEAAGVDMTNPLEIMIVLKRMDPAKIEQFFHSSVVNEGHSEVVPLIPATLWERAAIEKDQIINRVKDTPTGKKIKDKKMLVVSADVHSFGAYVVYSVLEGLGAEVVHGGVSLEALDVLDIADEYGMTDICISLHNGQMLDYSKLILELAANRGKDYHFYFGGNFMCYMNEGDTEPTDIKHLIDEQGITTIDTVEELLDELVK